MNRPQPSLPSPVKILAVDDNAAALYTTSRILKAAGFEIVTATTGRAALEAAPGADLVVLDVNLPDLDGYEVCRRLRENAATSRIPVLHLSATFVQTADAMVGLAAGADGYLTRPVEPAVLIATVRTLLFARHADLMRRGLDAKLRMVFELAPVPIAVLNANLEYESVNRRYCAFIGRSSDQLLGTSFRDGQGGDWGTLIEGARVAIENAGEWQGRSAVRREDKRELQVEWRVVREPVSGAYFVVADDVTLRCEQEAERERLLASERAARAEAERSNRLKDDFLATLSHELRNPLNAIVGWTTVLERSAEVPPSLGAAIAGIQRNCKVQAQMIGDLLDYAGITFGKMRLVPDTIDPYAVIREAIEVMRPSAASQGIELEMTLSEDPVHVQADAARLQQIVWNLLSNAIKFSDRSKKVSVSAAPVDGAFQLVVQDYGKGISSEFLPHVFERFSQENMRTSRRHGGLGIGLAIVKQLAEMQGGSVRALSEGEGHGATFVVEIPTTTLGGSVATREAPPRGEPLLSGCVVLVVEDDDDARELTRRILTEAGASVIEAASARAALARLSDCGADVLISDIGMPDVDGYELLREVRSRGYHAGTLPAVALTAYGQMQDRDMALAKGFAEHLVKPIEPRTLVAKIATLHRARNDGP